MQRSSNDHLTCKGSFVLSINDVAENREIFGWARIEEVKATYTIGVKNDAGGERAELLLRGCEL